MYVKVVYSTMYVSQCGPLYMYTVSRAIHGSLRYQYVLRYPHISSGSSAVHRYLYFAFIVANKYISSGSSAVHRIKYTSYRSDAIHGLTGYDRLNF